VRTQLVSLCLVAALGGSERPDGRGTSWGRCDERAGDALLSCLQECDLRRECGDCRACGRHRRFERELFRSGDPARFGRRHQPELRPYVLSPYREVTVKPTENVPETPAPAPPPERPSGVPDVPAPPRSLGPAPATPKISTPARPPKSPPDHSAAPMTEEVPEPAAGGPIKLFNM